MASSSSAATIADPAAPPADLSTRQKPGSSVRDQLPHELNSVLRPDDWGTRVLKDDSEVFTMNAWDHAPPPADILDQVERVKKVQREKPVSDQMKEVYNSSPASFWDRFYDSHRENFFKDRKWLNLEFPELMELAKPDAGPRTVIEIGCGAGNALFPIFQANENPELSLHGFDYSKTAIDVVKSNSLYMTPSSGVGKLNAAVWDLSSTEIPADIEPGTVDIAVMVFVMSALKPGEEWERAMGNLHKMLKPGGLILFRDYGRHDLAQMRIKGNRMLDEDFYIRGDGTRVFFFDSDDLAKIFTGEPAPFPVDVATSAGAVDGTSTPLDDSTPGTPLETPTPSDLSASLEDLNVAEVPVAVAGGISSTSTSSNYFPASPSPWHPPQPLFKLEQLGVDRRLLVNRKKQLKMYRVWMQLKARKLIDGVEPTEERLKVHGVGSWRESR